jgi:hypothetical protein
MAPSKVGMPVGAPWLVLADQQAKVKLQIILPMAVMFSLSLILSNIAYVHLSVSFVQMLKVSQRCRAPAGLHPDPRPRHPISRRVARWVVPDQMAAVRPVLS